MIRIEMSDGKVMTFQLDEQNAPITCANFVKLVKQGFYDGLTFHRIIKDFMIQGGDPLGTGTGGSSERIKGEFISNGINNQHKHTRGTISMARAQNPDSASSQFFICHVDTPHLDGNYAAFGQMVEGFDTLDEIASVPTDYNDHPFVDITIKSITII